MVSVCVRYFDFYKLPKSNLTNANIMGLVRFRPEQISANTDPSPEHVRPDRTNTTIHHLGNSATALSSAPSSWWVILLFRRVLVALWPFAVSIMLVWTLQFVFIVLLGLVFMGRRKCEAVAFKWNVIFMNFYTVYFMANKFDLIWKCKILFSQPPKGTSLREMTWPTVGILGSPPYLENGLS